MDTGTDSGPKRKAVPELVLSGVSPVPPLLEAWLRDLVPMHR